MTFLALYNELVQVAYPEGLARNLIKRTRNQLMAGLIDLQDAVPMLQSGQTEVKDQGATFWRCGVTLVDIPTLCIVNRVEVFAIDNECKVIGAFPLTKEQMEHKSNRCSNTAITPPPGAPDSLGRYTAGPSVDPAHPPQQYWASIIDDVLWLYPVMPSTHKVRFTWTGIKRDWADADVLPDTWLTGTGLDPEIFDFLSRYLMSIKYECDPNQLQVNETRFRERRRNMMTDAARREQYKLQLEYPRLPCNC